MSLIRLRTRLAGAATRRTLPQLSAWHRLHSWNQRGVRCCLCTSSDMKSRCPMYLLPTCERKTDEEWTNLVPDYRKGQFSSWWLPCLTGRPVLFSLTGHAERAEVRKAGSRGKSGSSLNPCTPRHGGWKNCP